MDDQTLESSGSAITPRMSICLKASRDDPDMALFLTEIEDDGFSLEDNNAENDNPPSKDEPSSTSNHRSKTRRSLLSSSSILLTGTPHSILSPSMSYDSVTTNTTTKMPTEDETDTQFGKSRQRGKRRKPGNDRVRFSESVHFRNYMHVTEITSEERAAAWFCGSEYRTIFRNNMRIIRSIAKREKELKKTIAKRKKEEQKLKKKLKKNKGKHSNNSNELGSCSDCGLCGDKSDLYWEEIISIERDEEQGYSVRGIENEIPKKRKKRDQVYLQAKYTILSLQADLDAHMEAMQDEYEERMQKLIEGFSRTKNGKKKKHDRRNSFSMSSSSAQQMERDERTEKEIRDITATNKFQFAQYAQSQYNNMIEAIAERYSEICKQHAKNALEAGCGDERTARAIDWLEESSRRNSVAVESASKGVLVDTAVLSDDADDKRRPSTSTTVTDNETIIPPLSMRSIDEARNSDEVESLKETISKNQAASRMKRARKFLRRLTM
ncbi:unnamed protein product [Pseudo-nitzschia multistriata]|uniref:Uncharacterized protein n=1 Tax=Pseudo-nitzschia multistriata TaxID=183589 RepID=A0A448YY82_9STRA|nr:unnamed protein product [Pseudo-nitzschia multistriata]